MSDHDDESWFEKKSSLKIIWAVLILLCAGSAIAGVVAAYQHLMHPYTAADRFPVFYGVFGFVAFSFIVLVGQHLRKILMRDEYYYDTEEDLKVHNDEDEDGEARNG
jgi:uncharacterized membrane protein